MKNYNVIETNYWRKEKKKKDCVAIIAIKRSEHLVYEG